jgi:hypothetical protein
MTADACIERPLFGGAISSYFPARLQVLSNLNYVSNLHLLFFFLKLLVMLVDASQVKDIFH